MADDGVVYLNKEIDTRKARIQIATRELKVLLSLLRRISEADCQKAEQGLKETSIQLQDLHPRE